MVQSVSESVARVFGVSIYRSIAIREIVREIRVSMVPVGLDDLRDYTHQNKVVSRESLVGLVRAHVLLRVWSGSDGCSRSSRLA